MAKISKAQKGAGVPKGYVKGEMTGRLIPEKEFYARRDSASKSLQQAVGPKSKPAPKPVVKKKMGGKLAKQAAIAISMKKKGIKPKKSK